MKYKIILQIILLVVLNISLKGQNNTARNYGYLKKNTEIKESELEYVDSLNIFLKLINMKSQLLKKIKFINF